MRKLSQLFTIIEHVIKSYKFITHNTVDITQRTSVSVSNETKQFELLTLQLPIRLDKLSHNTPHTNTADCRVIYALSYKYYWKTARFMHVKP